MGYLFRLYWFNIVKHLIYFREWEDKNNNEVIPILMFYIIIRFLIEEKKINEKIAQAN